MLLPFISENFNGIIWRIEMDGQTDIAFVEIRNSGEKLVSFASVNLSKGKVNFKDLIVPERWLTGIEAAYNGVLLLYNYQSENSPVHKGLTAIDAERGEILWSNYTYGFDHLSVNGSVLYNAQVQPKKIFIADIKTGNQVRSYNHEIDKELINNIVLPQILPVASLQKSLEIEPYGNNMHYLEFNNLRIVSLHTLEAGVLNQYLYITDNGQPVYQDILNTGIQKIQPEAFILYKNKLIYIKNKSELKALNL